MSAPKKSKPKQESVSPDKLRLIVQLKVSLQDAKPPIWRRVQVAGSTTLADLHRVIQRVMGWHDEHLHQFEVGKHRYGPPSGETSWGLEDPGLRSEADTRLAQVATKKGGRFAYEYDFGDSWRHDILVEDILQPAEGVSYPVCTAGEQACPPEDCGGVWGYTRLLKILADPDDPDYEDMLDWADEIDPEAFDLEAANEALRRGRRVR